MVMNTIRRLLHFWFYSRWIHLRSSIVRLFNHVHLNFEHVLGLRRYLLICMSRDWWGNLLKIAICLLYALSIDLLLERHLGLLHWTFSWCRLLVPLLTLTCRRSIRCLLILILIRRILRLTRRFLCLLYSLKSLVNKWITHYHRIPLLTFKLLLHQIHSLTWFLFTFATFLFLSVWYVLSVLGKAAILRLKFIETLKLTEHSVKTSNHVLAFSDHLRFIWYICCIPIILLSGLKASSAARNVLCIFFPCKPLKSFIKIFELFVLFFSQLWIIQAIPTLVVIGWMMRCYMHDVGTALLILLPLGVLNSTGNQ